MTRTERLPHDGTSRRRRPFWRRSGLRFRMTVSYALTTLAAVLVLEVLAATALWAVVTYGGVADRSLLAPARQTAKVYALAAAAQAGGAALDPRTTFEPGQPASIALPKGYLTNVG
jgi:hypothetical protein